MRFDITEDNNQRIVSMKHDSKFPKKFVVIEDDVEVPYVSNPGARELVLLKIEGLPETLAEKRFCVAFRHDLRDPITRLPMTFDKRADAEKIAVAFSSLYAHVLVLDVNYSVAPAKTEDEPDYESLDRDNYEDGGLRRPGSGFVMPREVDYVIEGYND